MSAEKQHCVELLIDLQGDDQGRNHEPPRSTPHRGHPDMDLEPTSRQRTHRGPKDKAHSADDKRYAHWVVSPGLRPLTHDCQPDRPGPTAERIHDPELVQRPV